MKKDHPIVEAILSLGQISHKTVVPFLEELNITTIWDHIKLIKEWEVNSYGSIDDNMNMFDICLPNSIITTHEFATLSAPLLLSNHLYMPDPFYMALMVLMDLREMNDTIPNAVIVKHTKAIASFMIVAFINYKKSRDSILMGKIVYCSRIKETIKDSILSYKATRELLSDMSQPPPKALILELICLFEKDNPYAKQKYGICHAFRRDLLLGALFKEPILNDIVARTRARRLYEFGSIIPFMSGVSIIELSELDSYFVQAMKDSSAIELGVYNFSDTVLELFSLNDIPIEIIPEIIVKEADALENFKYEFLLKLSKVNATVGTKEWKHQLRNVGVELRKNYQEHKNELLRIKKDYERNTKIKATLVAIPILGGIASWFILNYFSNIPYLSALISAMVSGVGTSISIDKLAEHWANYKRDCDKLEDNNLHLLWRLDKYRLE